MQLVNLDNTQMLLASLQRIGNQDLLGLPIQSTANIERAIALACDLFGSDKAVMATAHEKLALMIDSYPKSVQEYTATIRQVKAHELTNLINGYNDKLYNLLKLQANFNLNIFYKKSIEEILSASVDFLEESKVLLADEHEVLLRNFIRVKRIHDQIKLRYTGIKERAQILNDAGIKLSVIQSVCQLYHQTALNQIILLEPNKLEHVEDLNYLNFVVATADRVLTLINPAHKRIVEVVAWFRAINDNQKIALEIMQAHEKYLVTAQAHAVC
ncbi:MULTISPECIES: hypothetical protein [Acinetobacter]|uniref:Uncharacterized protein n=1 Tax=Acinetobacter indicus TaxID=756892 RepID=A0A6C0Y6I0_9GAMM|nr:MULTISPECIES: hypothetical protein [Acinetobacter]QIC71736.1 hypothetical protein FSC09_15185 [Acinetobacter indicus]QKQ71644.1 hypothetical protein E5Y90_15550 [Acinetobacter sp. 10FS3-1]